MLHVLKKLALIYAQHQMKKAVLALEDIFTFCFGTKVGRFSHSSGLS